LDEGLYNSITGRGADLLIIDDPHTEQDAMSDSAMERAYEWYSSGPRQRLQPGGNILLVMTRWAQDDLTGRLLKSQSDIKADKWNIIEFPAILPTGASVWPEYWSLEELEKVKASISVRNWNAQYMQDPVAEEGAILKREWWQSWKGQVPSLKHVIQSYDTAFSKKESADYSAITTWGVFEPTPGDNCLILLDAEKGRWDFPELKAVALEAYKYWEPESVIVEAKASGQSLIQEMRRAGIPVMDFIPSRGKDKHSRVNACAPVFESGNVYYPDDAHFAEEVIEECAAFPFAQHDDYVDSTTQAVLRYRQGNFVGTYMDEPEPMKIEQDYKYYG
jgi:predicted phage terminase large subunit-like protein